MKDCDFVSKVEEIVEKRRRENPLQQEHNRLLNEIYPTEPIENIYRLGYCYMLTMFKKDLSRYFCKDDQKVIDELVKNIRKDKAMDEMINRLLI